MENGANESKVTTPHEQFTNQRNSAVPECCLCSLIGKVACDGGDGLSPVVVVNFRWS